MDVLPGRRRPVPRGQRAAPGGETLHTSTTPSRRPSARDSCPVVGPSLPMPSPPSRTRSAAGTGSKDSSPTSRSPTSRPVSRSCERRPSASGRGCCHCRGSLQLVARPTSPTTCTSSRESLRPRGKCLCGSLRRGGRRRRRPRRAPSSSIRSSAKKPHQITATSESSNARRWDAYHLEKIEAAPEPEPHTGPRPRPRQVRELYHYLGVS